MAALSKEERREAMKMGGSMSLTARASELPSPAKPGHFLRTFGQSDREQIQNASDEASVPQALTLMNGPASEVLNNPASKISLDLKKAGAPQAADGHALPVLPQPHADQQRARRAQSGHSRSR